MAIVPPPVIEQRLSALIPRVRALRVARGACRLTAAALGTVAAVLLLDAGFGLPAWSRGLFLSVWLTGIGVLAWRWVIVPWVAEISLAEVARELEKRLPELGDRLRAAVEEQKPDAPRSLRAALDEDTARRARATNLSAALPRKQVAALAAVAVTPVLIAFALAFAVPGSGERLRRVALPWARTGGKAEFQVTTGELAVKRGAPVTVSGYTKQDSGKPAASEGVLCRRDGPGRPETRERLTFEGTAFHATLPGVTSDFEYCVEIGGVRSEWFRVTAFDAVELIEGTQIEIAPPAYANRPKHVLTTFTNLEALQFSTVEFRLKFNRPAAFAQLDWRPDGAPTSEIIPLALSPDQLSAMASLRLRQNGVLKLLLDSEVKGKRPRAETPAAVRLAPDAPPWFEQLTGLTARPRTARASDRVRIAFTASDDTAVSAAVLEYALGSFDSKSVQVPIPLTGNGSASHATGSLDFALADKFATSDRLYFRIRVLDNRNVDDPKLGPQEAVYPPAGWSELRLSADAPPLEQQDVICRRDDIRDGLSPAGKGVGEALAEVDALRRDTDGRDSLEFDHKARLNNLRLKLTAAAESLLALARDASLTAELRPIAAAVREVAEQPLRQAVELLQAAETDNPAARKDALAGATAKITEARDKITELLSRNAKFGQDRLDRLRLSALATDQAVLADAVKSGGDLLARQRDLLARFDAILAHSDPLRAAFEAAKRAELRRLANAARQLADSLRELDAAAKQTTAEARAALVAVIARDQNALSKQTAALFARLETPCRLAGVTLPRPEDFLRVADLAAQGKTVEALAELEKHALSLERIALAFDKWSAERGDPKFAAKQLSLWQEDLLSRHLAATKGAGFAGLPPAVKDAFRDEQKVISATLKALPLPPDTASREACKEAAIHTEMANASLAGNGANAEKAMLLAVKALAALSERAPTVAERLANAVRLLAPLRQEFDASANAVELAMKGYDAKAPDAATTTAAAKKLAPLAARQQKLIAGVAALDLPGLSERQARLIAALRAAVDDMQDGSPFDVAASQAWARREFDRLEAVLRGNPSPDAKADELYLKLAAMAASLDAHGPNLTPKLLEPTAGVVQFVSGQLAPGAFVAPEAPVLLNDARAAVKFAELGFRDAKPDEVRRRIRAAVDALAALTGRLNSFESDLERIQRLSWLRRLASEKPKEILFSDEAVRQLVREADELAATRVGPGGQVLKKRALDLYAKLRAKSNPDQVGTDLKTLATTLDELAAKMADIADLATAVPRGAPPGAAPDADSFLPSKALADEIRALAKQQRALHAQVTNLASELTSRLRPGAWSSPGRVILWQVARADSLAREVDDFIAMVEEASRLGGPENPNAELLRGVAKDAKEARRRLTEAARKASEGNPAQAEPLRVAAEVLLRVAGEKLLAVAPPGDVPAVGDHLRAAERAMRKATLHLAPDGDRGEAEKAMRDAAKALGEAEKNVGK
jgi:hypothetical protein